MRIFCDLDLSAPLQQVAAAILDRAQARALLADGQPWSMADLHADEEDLEFARTWLGRIDALRASAMIRPWPPLEVADRRIGTSAAFGFVFLFTAAEVARRSAIEGEVWGTVCRQIPWDRHAARVLFVQGQPNAELRDAIETAATRFGLRHVFGLEGGMAWMSTVYLQFGFTFRGFRNNLAEWLAGWHRPLALQRLLGPMRSPSFCALWTALIEWRHERRPESLTRKSISGNPWVLSEWVDDLLQNARERLHLRDAVGGGGEAEDELTESAWCSAPRLKWDGITEPRFGTELDLDAFPPEAPGYRVLVAGSPMAQLTRQADGRLAAMPAALVPLSNAMPVAEISILDSSGGTLLTSVLTLWEDTEDVQVFDLTSGARVQDPWEESLLETHDCALLLADDLVVEAATPTVWHSMPAVRRKLWRIRGTELTAVRVLLDGEELWRPLLRGQSAPPRWLCGLHLHAVVGGDGLLSLRATHAADVEVRSARLGTTTLSIAAHQNGSTHFSPVALSTTSAHSQFRVLAKIARHGVVERGWIGGRLGFSGACQLMPTGWVACSAMTSLTARDAASHLFRILPPHDGEPERPWILLEGESQRSRASEDAHSLSGLSGLGAPLTIRRGIFHGTEPRIIIGRVINPGVFRRSHLAIENGCAWLPLCSDLDLSPRHHAFAWAVDGVLSEIPRDGIVVVDCCLKLREIPSGTIAVALAYEGARLGSCWTDNWSAALTHFNGGDLAGHAAAILRWLHLPVLDHASHRNVHAFAARNAGPALGAWLAGRHLPAGFVAPPTTEGWLSAVRALFRGVSEFADADLIVEDALADNPKGNLLAELLPQSAWLLGRCDPILLGRVLRAWLAMRNAQAADRHCLAAILKNQFADLPPQAGAGFLHERLDALLAECARDLRAADTFVSHLATVAVGIFANGTVPEGFNRYNLLLAMNRDPFRRLVAIRILDLL